jgi:bifunctional UDP-N-acetylglucosamine pyrophosphorylase / glucosamine-1-phosphate N-acetyltransferase
VHRPSVVVILAAGEGTRMRSQIPKVLHEVAGRSLIGHVIEAAAGLEPEHIVLVVGHGREQVVAHVAEIAPWCVTVTQHEQRGTGHAVRIALEQLTEQSIGWREGPVMVLTGDTPLLQTATLAGLLGEHAAHNAAASLLTAEFSDPHGYGRVVRSADGSVSAIVEHADASPQVREIHEINAGMYVFEPGSLSQALGSLTTDNAQGEEYLPDVIAAIRESGGAVAAYVAPENDDVLGVNDRVQLAQASAVMRDRINRTWMQAGVSMLDPESIWLDIDVELAPDVVLLPQTILRGPTSVAEGARIGPGTTLISCEVGEQSQVIHTWAELAVVGPGAQIGPYSYLRPGTVLAENTKVGAFVEVKNTTVGAGSKIPHLSYVGDATIGEGTNIGAATVFVNYDGQEKHHTTVGDHVRIGSDTMLIAPVTIGDGAYTAAGSVITDDVAPGAMGVGRARQRNIDAWVMRRRPQSSSAQAAASAMDASTHQEEKP